MFRINSLKSNSWRPDWFRTIPVCAEDVLTELKRYSVATLKGEELERCLELLNRYPEKFPSNNSTYRLLEQLKSDWVEKPWLQWLCRKTANPGKAEADLQELNLERLLPNAVQGEALPQFFRKYYDNWFCQVFPFKDRYGEIRMQLIKLCYGKEQVKVLFPVTTWMHGNCPHNQIFCVPLPEDKQPLYNLDLLLKPETETVILTDSVELADSNQRNAPDGVVFTSFLCSPDRYD